MSKAVLAISIIVVLAIAPLALWLGLYDVGADTPHFQATRALLELLRERSIAVRAADLKVPTDFDSEESRLRRGAGNYDAMCVVCHLAPGSTATELSRGLYPSPPNLSEGPAREPAPVFWVIKHGIKASAMPAWGKSMSDADIWDLTAFVVSLPKMDPSRYASIVESSDGHSHASDESASEHRKDEPQVGPMPSRSHSTADPHPSTAGSSHADVDSSNAAGKGSSASPKPPQMPGHDVRPHGPPGHKH